MSSEKQRLYKIELECFQRATTLQAGFARPAVPKLTLTERLQTKRERERRIPQGHFFQRVRGF
jgi:hypothetical protein